MKELDISADKAAIIEKIIHFISTYVEERDIDGALVWFTGYIDSTLIAKFSIEALGVESVKLMVRCDKFAENQDKVLEESINYLGVKKENVQKCDIKDILQKIGSENLVPGSVREVPLLYGPLSYSLLRTTTLNEIESNTFVKVGKVTSGREELIHKIIAHNKLRSRIHMAIAYLTAETENRCLIGTINKTELSTGLFTKWGKGHSADLMPLGHLYRTQIIQLAEYLGIPEDIRNLAKADLLPGIENKYQFFFELSAYDVDRILVRLEAGFNNQKICEETNITVEQVRKINDFFIASSYARNAPLVPKL